MACASSPCWWSSVGRHIGKSQILCPRKYRGRVAVGVCDGCVMQTSVAFRHGVDRTIPMVRGT